MKLGQVGVSLNIPQNNSSSLWEVISSHFTQIHIGVGSNMSQNHLKKFAPKYHFCLIISLIYPYLALNTYIFVIFALNCPDLTRCAILTQQRYSSIETAHLCKILEQTSYRHQNLKQSDNYLRRYCILKIWGIQSVVWL